jgi:hypothetical protein
VDLLRRLLYLDALITALGGLALLAAPRLVVATALQQTDPPDHAWLRLLGLAGFTLALLMVLVAHRIDDVWWWSWAFVILAVGAAAVTTLHAAFGLPHRAAAWPWVVMAALSWFFAFGLLWGLARSGLERPLP